MNLTAPSMQLTKFVHDYAEYVKIISEVKQELMNFDKIMYYAKHTAREYGKIEEKANSIFELFQEYDSIPQN